MVKNTTLVFLIIISLIIGGLVGYYAKPSTSPSSKVTSEYQTSINMNKQITLYTTMRKLWADHVFWTREYIIAAATDEHNAEAAATRLLKNQEDIGNAIAGYYGNDAGSKLTSLLKEHINIAVEIVPAAKANDQVKLKNAQDRWTQNAIQIADFLAQANPNIPKGDIEDAMKMHLSTTADELTAILKNDYTGSTSRFDTVFDHMMKMSDELSGAIVKQFPEKF
jgi:hypothetical protein